MENQFVCSTDVRLPSIGKVTDLYMEFSLCDDTFLFRNATHMNKKGAELFSIRLAEDLEKLGIIQSENGKIIEK